MCCAYKMWWLVSGVIVTAASVNMSTNKQKHLLTSNISEARSVFVSEDRQDGSTFQNSYYPYPSYGPPPTYGPPGEGLEGTVILEYGFKDIVLKCVAEEPFEHIVWLKYECPQQLLYRSEGVHVADGSAVSDHYLYDVHVQGHGGKFISELRIKRPLEHDSEGVYQCQVWPHVHGSGYHPYNPYHGSSPLVSDIFMFGGSALLEECFHHGNSFKPGGANKEESKNSNELTLKENFSLIKPRNETEIRRIHYYKQPRSNLKYVNNSIYRDDSVNVTKKLVLF